MSTPQVKSNTSTILDSTTQIGAIKVELTSFVDFIGQTPFTPSHIAGGLDQSVVDQITKANHLIGNAFENAKNSAGDMINEIHALSDFLDAAQQFANNCSQLSPVIAEDLKKYLAHPSSDPSELTQLLQAYAVEAGTYAQVAQQMVAKFDGGHVNFNNDVSMIQSAIDTFESIGKENGDKLNITKLSEAELKKQLQAKVADITSKISDLEKKFNGGVAGAVLGGVAAAGIAVSNFWNPIGWVAGLGLIFGEVFGGMKLHEIKQEIDTDQEELALTEEEINLLQPLYMCQRVDRKMKEIVDHLTSTSSALNKLKEDFNDYANDVQKFDTAKISVLAKIDWNDITADLNNIMKQVNFFTSPITQSVQIPMKDLKITPTPKK